MEKSDPGVLRIGPRLPAARQAGIPCLSGARWELSRIIFPIGDQKYVDRCEGKIY
jgi:hypothetical protein